jgi:hypothetical protein
LAAGLLGVVGGSAEAQVASSITTNFNGTNINPPAFIWFNSVFKIKSGTVNVGDKLFLTGGTIVDADTDPQNFVPNPLPVPDAEITFTAATTSANFTGGKWYIEVPYNYTGDIFLDGLWYTVQAGGLNGDSQSPMWTEWFSTTASSLQLDWQIRAAIYNTDISSYNDLNVAVIDGYPFAGTHAGEPANDLYCNNHLVGGGTGGAGSNCTGSNSGTVSLNVATVPNVVTPEPGVMILLSSGMVGLVGAGFIRRRRR